MPSTSAVSEAHKVLTQPSLNTQISKPHFKTHFESVKDYISYGQDLRPKFPTQIDAKTHEALPDMDMDSRKSFAVGPHPEEKLDIDKPFDLVSFRRGPGAPLGITTNKLDHLLLTSNVSNCCMVRMCATNPEETLGAHSLFHVYYDNTDVLKTLFAEMQGLRDQGFTRFKMAHALGASTNPKDYLIPQTLEARLKTVNMAKSIVGGLRQLNFEKVIDNTMEHRPAYATKEVNLGGKMVLDKGKIDFPSISNGYFQ